VRDSLPTLATVEEVAERLALSQKTIRRWIKSQRLVAHRVGKNVRVDAASVTRLLATPGTAVVQSTTPVKKNNVMSEPRLLRQRGRAKLWTALIEGEEVFLATSNRDEAELALGRIAQEQEDAPLARKAWGVYRDAERNAFLMKYYDKVSRRRQHRLPATIQTEGEADEYAARYYTDHVGRGAQREHVKATGELPRSITFEQFGHLWTSGKLAQMYSDHVRVKVSASDDESKLRNYVYPVIGSFPVTEFEAERGLQLVEQVRDRLPSELSRATRRHVLQGVNRLLTLAVYPAKLLPANPLPKGFLPKAKAYLYPAEDRALLACGDVPLLHRMFYGLLVREGLRVSELLGLTWDGVDLVNNVLSLDKNKTNDPRSWAMDPGVAEGLRRWRDRFCKQRLRANSILVASDNTTVNEFSAARLLRSYLQLAGITRPQLFEHGDSRMRLRAHDLRASFVTVHLALGRSEAWITDRTGHKSSQMIYKYKRAARTHAELNLGGFTPLIEAIPELR